MKLNEIRLQFDAGAFKGCSVTRPMLSNEGYILICHGKKSSLDTYLTAQRGTDARVFKTTDAAISAAYQIGFREIMVSLSELK
ncbi:plasmid replication protein RepB [Vibrio splendidus]